ncbi:MAG: dephospho-CoA kinase [Syntrophobacteraceae bacterium CG2_30_61_12]|nr:MAG: dephospho-CoA kinase [Syntrophobacteraceae bacterium CG2_30_61_12]
MAAAAAGGGRRWALTGGIASGKSTVARIFAELGALVLDADAAARQVVEPGAPGWRKLRDALGADYFEAGGELDRARLRRRIVADPAVRGQVERLLHPEIMRSLEAAWIESRTKAPERPILFDIPLLFEAGLEARFDVVVLVYVPRSVQLERLMARDHLSREEAAATLEMQLPLTAKRERSHWVIDNSGSLDQTRRQVLALWAQFKSEC